MKEHKARLRREIKEKVRGFAPDYLTLSDREIARRLLALPEFAAAKTLFSYVSVDREPDTRALIEQALSAGKRVCVPRCLGGGIMQARQIFSLNDVHPAGMGLLDPDESAPLVPPGDIDIVVAPCVAADKKGMRLGRGGGYYDRFLAQVRCPVVCLCRGRLLHEELPAEAFDKPVSMILTEEDLHHFG